MDAPFIAQSANNFKTEPRPRKAMPIVDLSERSVARIARDLDGDFIDAIGGRAIVLSPKPLHRIRQSYVLARLIQLSVGALVTLPPGATNNSFDTTLAAILSGTMRRLNNECCVAWFGGRTAFVVPQAGAPRVLLYGMHGSVPVPIRMLEKWPPKTLRQLVAATGYAEAITYEAASARGIHDSPNTLLAYCDSTTRDANATLLAALAPRPEWLQ